MFFARLKEFFEEFFEDNKQYFVFRRALFNIVKNKIRLRKYVEEKSLETPFGFKLVIEDKDLQEAGVAKSVDEFIGTDNGKMAIRYLWRYCRGIYKAEIIKFEGKTKILVLVDSFEF